ncbi:MAG: hypothetical protein LAO09_15595 [Acidobacteriia bacterium]|nr:hypothetical protein [Terriglobia bacterium]
MSMFSPSSSATLRDACRRCFAFLVAQLVVMAIFVVLTIAAAKRFHTAAA